MTTIEKPEVKRRQQRATHAVTWTRGKKEVGTAKSEAAGAVRLSTDRRFVMMGNWVRILCGYAEGQLGRVLKPDLGDGKVLVNLGTFESPRPACYTVREMEHVPEPGCRRVNMDEWILLVERHVRLSVEGKCNRSLGQVAQVACARRAEKIEVEMKAISRMQSSDLLKCARYADLGLPNLCTALVPYTGGQES